MRTERMIIDLPRQNIYKAPLLIHLQREGVARLNPYLVAKEFELRGRDVVWTSTSSLYVFGSDPKIAIDGSCPVGHSVDGRSILDDKIRYRALLSDSGIKVPFGRSFSSTEEEEAKEFCCSSHRPMVVKPSHGNKGRAVSVGIQSGVGFEQAWRRACQHNTHRARNADSSVLIEEQFEGAELRFLVVGTHCVGVYHKVQPTVVGNGRDSVHELIQHINTVKLENPTEWDKLITIDELRLSIIKAQGHEFNSIPKRGEVVILDYKSSASSGAQTFAVTDMVHESLKDLAASAASMADSPPVAGIDMLVEDFTRDVNETSYAVLEGNSRPGLGGHHFPSYGEPVNVARHIAEYCLGSARDGKAEKQKKLFSIVVTPIGGIDRDKIENVLQACDARIRSISSDENRLRIYIDDSADKCVSLSSRLRDALTDGDTAVLMEEKRYVDYTVRILIQGSGTQEPNYPVWLERQAEMRGLKSEVRRLPGGDVEATFSGERVEVGNVILKCGLELGDQTGRKVSLWKIL